MGPLITIETVPISIEYVEKQSPCPANSDSATLRISPKADNMTIEIPKISISMADTFENYSEAGYDSLTYTASAQYSRDGSLQMDVQFDGSPSSDFAFRQFDRSIDNLIGHIPDTRSSRLGNLQINFDLSRLHESIPNADSMDLHLIPSDLEIKVVERPKVIIKYIGGPIYIPKSADPNYVPPQEKAQIFDGKPALDLKA